MVNELYICFLLSFLLALSSLSLSLSLSLPFTVAKKLGQCVLLTSVHTLGMQWPDYLVNLLFHSYYFSSSSRPTPSFRPLTQQPNCLASFHPFEISSFKGASSLFTPSPLLAVGGLGCSMIIVIGLCTCRFCTQALNWLAGLQCDKSAVT